MSALLTDHLGTLIRGGLSLLALAMILFLGVRPALARLRETGAGADGPANTPEATPAGAVTSRQAAEAAVADPRIGEASDGQSDSADDRSVSLASVRGSVMQRYIDELAGIVGDNREESIRVLRSWIHQKG